MNVDEDDDDDDGRRVEYDNIDDDFNVRSHSICAISRECSSADLTYEQYCFAFVMHSVS